MRARNIKPGFFKNEFLAECDPMARLLFAGLWCLVDKEGFAEYRPKRIKAEIFPYDSCNVEKFIEQLGTHNFITIWCTLDGHGRKIPKVIEVNNFREHQNPHKNEKGSNISHLFRDQENSGNFVKLHDDNGYHPADSLIPDSLIPDIKTGRVKGEKKKKKKNGPSAQEIEKEFERWYQHFPKKRKRADALKAFTAAHKKGILPGIDELVKITNAHVEHWSATDTGVKYIPYPATWIRAESWKDELFTPGPVRNAAAQQPHHVQILDEAFHVLTSCGQLGFSTFCDKHGLDESDRQCIIERAKT